MSEFIFASFNSYYSIAFSIVLLLLFIELAGQFAGLSISQLFDSSAELDTVGDASGSLGLLGWLGIKKLPALIWLVSFLTIFSIIGYTLSYVTYLLVDFPLPKVLAGLFVFVLSLLLNRPVCDKLAKLLPKEETSAVSKDSFSGLLAQITIGKAKRGQPAEAVVKDEFDQKHYLLVEPIDEDEFKQGDNVVLVVKKDSLWLVTRFDEYDKI